YEQHGYRKTMASRSGCDDSHPGALEGTAEKSSRIPLPDLREGAPGQRSASPLGLRTAIDLQLRVRGAKKEKDKNEVAKHVTPLLKGGAAPRINAGIRVPEQNR
ncbi:MAG: hypothetical protein WB402_11920, partial [Sulfuricaulis sp.]|uniref:hypothetical protein n=1 Tax=Sulfuricaulis sp. TaxID=2003553 RepID=UPI003C492CBE